MKVVSHPAAAGFWEAAGRLLLADPVAHTLVLSLTRRALLGLLSSSGPPVLLTVHDGPNVIGAALRSSPNPIVLSAVPPYAIPAVIDHLRAEDIELTGATGSRPAVEAFAAAWTAQTGAVQVGHRDERLYSLGELTPPSNVPGEPTKAGEDDVDLLAGWRAGFAAEALGGPFTAAESTRQVRASLTMGNGLVLWRVDGVPVAYAAVGRPVDGAMSRIGPVYTPAEFRGRGYGSAVTAAAARWALDRGAEHVVLFTDLANPVSNSIYQRLGFRAVSDAMEVSFGRPG